MAATLPTLTLARHGETAWSLSGQHTGLTDIPLTFKGEQAALRLGERLKPQSFAKVFTSPLQRAFNTCKLAGYETVAEIDGNLVEWDYGEYEGLRTADIRKTRPGWQVFRDGCPGGETIAEVAARTDRVIANVRALGGDCLVFSSGHTLRILAARWLGQGPAFGQHLFLSTATISILGYEHDLDRPVIKLWNSSDA